MSEKVNKAFKTLLITGCVIGAIVAGIFINANVRTTMPSTAIINNVDVGGMTAEEANSALNDTIREKGFRIKIDDVSAKITIDKEIDIKQDLRYIIKMSRLNIFLHHELKINHPMSFKIKNGQNLTEEIEKQLKKKYPADGSTIKTKNASIDPNSLTIKEEVYGTELDYNKIEKTIISGLNKGNLSIAIKSKDYYKKPEIKKDDERLLNALSFYKDYLSNEFLVKYPSGAEKKLTNSQVYNMVEYNLDTGQVTYNHEKIAVITQELAKNIAQDDIEVNTHEGKKTLTDYNGIMKIDIEKSTNILEEALKTKTTAKLKYVDEQNIMKTRVEVDKTHQMVYLYVNGKEIYKTECVTGKHGHDTPIGIFSIDYKTTNVHLKGFNDDGTRYDSPVSYWMPFNDGIGLHDANWRGDFGGDIWYYSGSHGCVNLPYNAAKKIYSYVDTGIPVIVYK